MEILQYNNLDYSRLKGQYKKIISMLKNDDFYSAEVKKIANTPYYRAKLDYANRLLFKIVKYNKKKYALILEIIYNHNYAASKFLRGAQVNESQVINPSKLEGDNLESIIYINEKVPSFNILDKIISFDSSQDEIYRLRLPLIIIGSAGSGKTILTLEKMKEFYGDILYITHSPFLVENSRNLYHANQYSNEDQNIDFLSYRELLETVRVPDGKEIDGKIFSAWLTRQGRSKLFNDANKLYEEFKGVITGSDIKQKYLSCYDYTNLGIKQSIFHSEERPLVYSLFTKYLKFLSEEKIYDSNILSFEYLSLCQPKYDFIVVDEIQDFTKIQLHFILRMLNNKSQFILSGDSNQIVHPNFFSWSKVKTMFYQEEHDAATDIMRILYKNYRNSSPVIEVANNILRLKNLRFGSIDKESNYLIESRADKTGTIMYLAANSSIMTELNQNTRKSTKYAVIVLHEDLKNAARKHFQTPLVFSIQEAKGLEYKNVILFNFISCEEKKYHEIAKGLTTEDLQQGLTYARAKDKSDRSLEIYKFYINAFYVAITRAIDNIYIIEDCDKHAFIEILGLKNINSTIAITSEESSLEEWRQEARKLEMQGKTEQAEEIRNSILAQKQTPWHPITKEEFTELQTRIFDVASPDKKAMLLLFEYAVIYRQTQVISRLKGLNFKPTRHIDAARDVIERKYFLFYGSQNISTVVRDVNTYGVDFRNQFNQTPLMIASSRGNVSLVQYLVENGANPSIVDNVGRTALQSVLCQAYSDNKYAQTRLAALYGLLAPSSISVKVADKLIKIDKHLMEFFLLNLVIALSYDRFSNENFYYASAFCADDFLEPLEKFPESVLLDRRKKRSYVSSVLSKNEVSRDDRYNRKLFFRVRRGYYIFNPELELKLRDTWIPLHTIVAADLARLKNVF